MNSKEIMKNVKGIMRLIRIEHSIMLVLGVITVILLIHGNPSYVQLIHLFISPFLISAGAFALNDYFDAESDKINRKNRPIALGEVSKRDAMAVSIVCLALGVAAAIPLGLNAFIIALFFALLSIAYDYRLKDVALMGNAIIASSMAIVFIFTNVALLGGMNEIIAWVSAVSFLSGFGREIQKTVQDVKGDEKARKSKTLPMIIGREDALHVAVIFLIIASAIALYLFFAIPPLENNILYFIVALISIGGFAYSTKLFYGNEKEMEKGRKYSLYSLIIGVLAFLIGGL